MTELRLLYVTASDSRQAEFIAETLLRERLVACANILPQVQSLYWWNGALQSDKEAILILKTHEDLVQQAMERIKALHTYECPCVISVAIDSGLPAYLNWIQKEASAEPTR